MKTIIITVLLAITTAYSQLPLPTQTSSLFSGSGNCINCHSSNGTNVLTYNGIDIAPVTGWRSSMMGNSSKDPLWRAEVAEEGLELPAYKNFIETTCTKCHAPMGYTQAKFDGQEFYTLNELKASPLANDGASCTLCHQIDAGNLGSDSSYSGGYKIAPVRKIYGPFSNPFSGPMINNVDYLPFFSPHVKSSELCATCHTLFTPYFNSQNQLGGYFPEQTPYLEWKNSNYSQNGVSCQNCHMPEINEGIDISLMPPWHNVLRSPYGKHDLVGANVYMQTLLRDNIDSLGLTTGPAFFDSTIQKTRTMLNNSTARLLITPSFSSNTLSVTITVENLAGHKLPTGIPLRRLWLHTKIINSNGITVFESGAWDANGEIIGKDTPFEPHHDTITSANDVQIYEAVLHNSDNQLTYTLLRAAGYLKDNRIPPAGFTSSHISYDSIKIYGIGSDTNFNRHADGSEGSGSDKVTYVVSGVPPDNYRVVAELCYQTVKPEIVHHLASLNAPDITKFIGIYNVSGNNPQVIARSEKNIVLTENPENYDVSSNGIKLIGTYPNPGNPGLHFRIEVSSPMIVEAGIYSLLGEKLDDIYYGNVEKGIRTFYWNGTSGKADFIPSGVYFYRITGENESITGKLVLLR